MPTRQRFMPTRPIRRLVVLACVVLAAALVAPTRGQEKQQGKKKDPAEVMKSMEQLVKDYQDENLALRERVKELEGQVETLKQNRTVNVVPQPNAAAAPGQQVPQNWTPFQFNGATYYVVPVAHGGSADAAVLRPADGAAVQRQPVRVLTAPASPSAAGQPAGKP